MGGGDVSQDSVRIGEAPLLGIGRLWLKLRKLRLVSKRRRNGGVNMPGRKELGSEET
jgi:hypothetical protein